MMYLGMSLALGMMVLLTFEACERQGPPPKPIGSATNKHVEEAPATPSRLDANTLIQNMMTPMENARQTEDLLKGAADRTQQQSDQMTR